MGNYLTFSSPNSFTLKTYTGTKRWDGTLEYSTDKITWNEWNGTTLSADNGKLYLRGTGNTVITGDAYLGSTDHRWVLDGSNIACEGNIENLLDYATVASGEHPTMGKKCYEHMFYGCTSLTSAPDLPATTLADDCYSNMFQGCTSLTSAPTLPATTLASWCYSVMFSGCTSLTSAPALPAKTLKAGCYELMFYGCTNLTSAPALPATTLAGNCYRNMFNGCTSLTSAPELPATTMSKYCYYGMFYGCTSLTSAPALPATTLDENCYDRMFYGCTSLTSASVLPAKTLKYNCYWHMFEGCTSLTSAPDLLATTLAQNCCSGMFYGCTSLTSASALPATTLAIDCYLAMFYGCTSLKSAPALPATTLASRCYTEMFKGCTSLTSAPELPAKTLKSSCYSNMFYGCTSLTSAPELPATTLELSCYGYMFYGCASLTRAPELPATTLASGCYMYMFKDCVNLKISTTQTSEYSIEYRIPTNGNGTTATNAMYDMFGGTGGTFTGTPEINTTYYISNEGIPTIIIYNGSAIASLKAGQTATVKTANTEVDYDIVVKAAEQKEPKLQEKSTDKNGEVLPDEGYDGLSKVTVNVPSAGSPLPIEVSTEAEMNALLETAEVGSVYKYVGETGVYENGALYVVEGDGVKLISFTIDGVTYQAEEGMTWAEWGADETYTKGDYNVLGDLYVYKSDTGQLVCAEAYGRYVERTETIIAEHNYGITPIGN